MYLSIVWSHLSCLIMTRQVRTPHCHPLPIPPPLTWLRMCRSVWYSAQTKRKIWTANGGRDGGLWQPIYTLSEGRSLTAQQKASPSMIMCLSLSIKWPQLLGSEGVRVFKVWVVRVFRCEFTKFPHSVCTCFVFQVKTDVRSMVRSRASPTCIQSWNSHFRTSGFDDTGDDTTSRCKRRSLSEAPQPLQNIPNIICLWKGIPSHIKMGAHEPEFVDYRLTSSFPAWGPPPIRAMRSIYAICASDCNMERDISMRSQVENKKTNAFTRRQQSKKISHLENWHDAARHVRLIRGRKLCIEFDPGHRKFHCYHVR